MARPTLSGRNDRDFRPGPARHYRPARAYCQNRRHRRARWRRQGAPGADRTPEGRHYTGTRRIVGPPLGQARCGARDHPWPCLPDRSADPHGARSCRRRSLSRRQPVERRASDADCGRWLWARRDGAIFRRRHRLPHPDQGHCLVRASDRGDPLFPVGPGPDRRPFQPLPERDGAHGERGSDDPHLAARKPLSVGRQGTVSRGTRPLLERGRPRFRSALHQRKAGRARCAAQADGRFPLRGRAQCERGQGRAARPANALLDRQIHLPRAQRSRAGREGAVLPSGIRHLSPRRTIPAGRALPFAHDCEPCRRPPDLRPSARGRAAHELCRPQG